MNYDRDILHILDEAGINGLSVRKIARHVFNGYNNFFDNVSFDDVYHYVASYLIRNSKSKDSIIERTEIRGVYRINRSSGIIRQLCFDFKDGDIDIKSDDNNIEDHSLSLF